MEAPIQMNRQIEIQSKKYQIERSIGEGISANVYLIRDQNNRPYALKYFKPGVFVKERANEIDVLQKINHNNIVRIYQYTTGFLYCYRHQDDFILTEHHGNGDLFDLINHSKIQLSEDQSWVIFRQIFDALDYLHSNHIYHRDVKLENILVNFETLQAKICDFGLSVTNKEALRCVGTQGYIAPELYYNDTLINPEELAKTDIFSLGVVLFCLLFKHMPFSDTRKTKCIYFKLVSDKKWTHYWKAIDKNQRSGRQISTEAKELLQGFFEVNPEKRPSLNDIKESSWFKRYSPDLQ